MSICALERIWEVARHLPFQIFAFMKKAKIEKKNSFLVVFQDHYSVTSRHWGESIHYPSLRTCRLGEQRRHLADELSHYVHTQMGEWYIGLAWCASGMLMDDCLPCLAYFPSLSYMLVTPFLYIELRPVDYYSLSFLLLSSSCISLLFSFRLISTFDAGPLSNSLEW